MPFFKDLLQSRSQQKSTKYKYLRADDLRETTSSKAGPSRSPHVAGADSLFNQGYALYIEHVPTGYFVEFPAMIGMLSDAYMTKWTPEKVYGRMDPIATYSDTSRAISVQWNVISDSVEGAIENLNKINGLLSFLYPLYEEQGEGGGAILNMGPLLRIKFGNLIQNAQTGGGLLGYINGVTFDPDIAEGGMWEYASGGPMGTGGVEYIPKMVRLNMEMSVLHEHEMGWKNVGDGQFVWRGSTPLDAEASPISFPFGTATSNVEGVSAIGAAKSKQGGFDPNTPANARSTVVTKN